MQNAESGKCKVKGIGCTATVNSAFSILNSALFFPIVGAGIWSARLMKP